MPRVWNKKHSGVPHDAIYIGRPSLWGNPFIIGRDGTREEVIEKFRLYILRSKLDLSPLKGKHLVCWCKPQACHGDILLELANADN